MSCLSPPLTTIPLGEWYCPGCHHAGRTQGGATTNPHIWFCPDCKAERQLCLCCGKGGPTPVVDMGDVGDMGLGGGGASSSSSGRSGSSGSSGSSSSCSTSRGGRGESVVVKCALASCGRFYHYACIRKEPLAHFYGNSHSLFSCPQHYCATCETPGDLNSMLICCRCPSAFHAQCLPPIEEGSWRSVMGRQIVCPHHTQDTRRRNRRIVLGRGKQKQSHAPVVVGGGGGNAQ